MFAGICTALIWHAWLLFHGTPRLATPISQSSYARIKRIYYGHFFGLPKIRKSLKDQNLMIPLQCVTLPLDTVAK
jgi:hypothetical protein